MTLTARTLADAIAELAAQGYTETLQIQGKTPLPQRQRQH